MGAFSIIYWYLDFHPFTQHVHAEAAHNQAKTHARTEGTNRPLSSTSCLCSSAIIHPLTNRRKFALEEKFILNLLNNMLLRVMNESNVSPHIESIGDILFLLISHICGTMPSEITGGYNCVHVLFYR